MEEAAGPGAPRANFCRAEPRASGTEPQEPRTRALVWERALGATTQASPYPVLGLQPSGGPVAHAAQVVFLFFF